jgi:matrixin/putative Ig domain-containing protein
MATRPELSRLLYKQIERLHDMKKFCRKIPGPFLFGLLALVFVQPTKATTAIMLSDAELIVHSRLIVSGSVISVVSDLDSSGMVWTYVEVRTRRVLKGALLERTIVLKQLGGTAGESGVRVAGQAGFTIGERVLLFLNTGADGSLHVAHGFMGKYSVVEDASGVEFVERSIDAAEVKLMTRTNPGDVTDRAPYDAYAGKIQRTLRREAALVAELDAAKSGEPFVTVPKEFLRVKRQTGDVGPEFVFMAGPVRWMEADSGQAVRYFVNPNASPVAGGGSAEIARAMAAWTNQSGAAIQLQVAGQTGSCGIVFDNVNTISFGDCLNQLDPPIGCAGIVALTAISWIRETKVIAGTVFNRLIEADTVFNDGMNCFLANSANLAEVGCHELGHAIGLGHSTDPSALMWATAHGRGRDATLGADDRAGVLAIYPASTGGGNPGPGAGGPVSIATLSMNDGFVGRSYSMSLTATGGTPPYRWSLIGGTLPSGLRLSTNGTIDGLPNFAGSSTFATQVIDSGNPVRVDSRWFSVTIRESGGGGLPGFPAITGVKIKGVKKLWVFGEYFQANSLIVINGLLFEPVQFVHDGSVGQLLAKGKLNLGPPGTNVVVVINSDNQSVPHIF